ncbi:hypothetical protein Bca101_061085 [Brassica carinata]
MKWTTVKRSRLPLMKKKEDSDDEGKETVYDNDDVYDHDGSIEENENDEGEESEEEVGEKTKAVANNVEFG